MLKSATVQPACSASAVIPVRRTVPIRRPVELALSAVRAIGTLVPGSSVPVVLACNVSSGAVPATPAEPVPLPALVQYAQATPPPASTAVATLATSRMRPMRTRNRPPDKVRRSLRGSLTQT